MLKRVFGKEFRLGSQARRLLSTTSPYFTYPEAEKGYPKGPIAWDGTEAVWSSKKLHWDKSEERIEGLNGRVVLSRIKSIEGEILDWGCELTGIKLGDDDALDDDFLHFLADAVHRFGAVILRKQGMAPSRQVEVARKLSPLLGAKLPLTSAADNGFKAEDLVPGLPEISCLGTKERGFDEENMYGKPVNNSVKGIQWPDFGPCSWHVDGAAFETVGSFTFMTMPRAPGPNNGGATLLASGYLAYDNLPQDLKTQAEAATIRYISDANWQHVYDMKSNGCRRINEPGEIETEYDHTHPLVVTHPVTGHKALWAAPANVQGFEVSLPGGLDNAQDLVEQCFLAGISQVYTHFYEDGDAVISDDRSMLHSTTPFSPETKTRILHRCGTELRSPSHRHKAFQYAYDTPGAQLKGTFSFQPRTELSAPTITAAKHHA